MSELVLRHSDCIEIDRSPSEVFRFVADPRNDPLWCPTVLESTQTHGDAVRAGARFRSKHKPGPLPAEEFEVEVLEAEAPARLHCRYQDAQGYYLYTYTLEARAAGTWIEHATESHFASFLRFFGLVLRPHIRKVMATQLRNLKETLEAERVTDSGG
jgi:uncharacterized protein YndB with AHSA1/START domain